MGFPVQLLLFITKLCTGEIGSTVHGVVHSDSTEVTALETPKAEIICTSKSTL